MSDSQRPRDASDASAQFQQALERFERAVQELVASKKDELTDRATAFIDDTTRRLQREFRSAMGADSQRSDLGNGRASQESQGHHGYRRQRCGSRRPRGRGRSRRDPTRPMIAGVCARIADQYGMEPWVVRLTAVTGLLFLPSIVFPAYWITWFVFRRPQRQESSDESTQRNHSSPAPEFGPQLSPRRSLRKVQDTLADAELKLRRMESHITSGQFELQRELRKIDT